MSTVPTKVGDWNKPEWVEDYSWYPVADHLWLCLETELYHFNDEASQLDVMGYATLADADEALTKYAETL